MIYLVGTCNWMFQCIVGEVWNSKIKIAECMGWDFFELTDSPLPNLCSSIDLLLFDFSLFLDTMISNWPMCNGDLSDRVLCHPPTFKSHRLKLHVLMMCKAIYVFCKWSLCKADVLIMQGAQFAGSWAAVQRRGLVTDPQDDNCFFWDKTAVVSPMMRLKMSQVRNVLFAQNGFAMELLLIL